MQKCETVEEVISYILSAQQAAFVCSSLKKSSIGEQNEISLDLYEQNNPLKPRYTVYVVEISPEAKNSPYAAFIVPEGRETEWLFSTKTGRKNLVTMTNHNRLAIVTMHRGQKYESLDAIKKELEDIVCNLAPSNLKNRKIAFLTLGSDLGRRIIKYEGKSNYSGDYVVEDVEHDNGQKFRRLFYLSSQLVIQSEAKIKTVKSRSGKPREVIDLATLTCQHHIYMSIAAYMICQNKPNPKITVLGLGGGGLCSFLHKFIPSAVITGVDVDPEMLKIATEWFSFVQNDKLQAKIQDGLEFIRQLDKTGERVDAILCDVDNKDSEVGMSCPPKEFLAPDLLAIVSKILTDRGLFIANIVLRDHMLRPNILNQLKKAFKTIISYKLTEDLNEIFICTNMEAKDEYFRSNLRNASEAINVFFKKNNVKDDVEVIEYINDLKINS